MAVTGGEVKKTVRRMRVVEPVPVVAVDAVPAERIRCSVDTYRWLFGDGWDGARPS